jgi:NADH:ubiquinone oxidoreductase subunit H
LILIRGWASQSKFAMIGRIRRLAQAVSFEMLATVVLLFPYLVNFVFTWDYVWVYTLFVAVII